MSDVLHIVALGARTPVGLTAESAAAAVRAGVSRYREHPFMVDAMGDPMKCAIDARLEPSLGARDRMAAMASDAVAQVLGALSTQVAGEVAVPVLLALPELRPGFGAIDAEEVARAVAAVRARGVSVERVSWFTEGHAGALRAVETARREMASAGAIGLCVVCGVDSYFDADTLDWLEAHRRLRRDGARGAFVPGEGAGAVALASVMTAARVGLPVLATVTGVGTAIEARSPTSDVGLLGEAWSEALQRAGGEARAASELVDGIYCDINGERHRTDDWGFVLLRLTSWFRDGTAYQTAVDVWGDVGAATGALGCVLAARAWQRGYARGPRAVVCGGSDSGLRGAVLLEQPGGRS